MKTCSALAWLDTVIAETEQLLLELYEQRCNPDAAKYLEKAAKAELRQQKVNRYNKQYYLQKLKPNQARTAQRRRASSSANEGKSTGGQKQPLQGGSPEQEHKMSFTLFGST